MTSNVQMYATAACPYCRQAEALLREVGVEQIEKLRVDLYPSQLQFMHARTGRRTVPQIFVGQVHVGGYDELVELHRTGRLLSLLDQSHQSDESMNNVKTTRWSSNRPEDRFEVENPATREVIAVVQGCGPEEVSAAIAAAQVGFRQWSQRPARERGKFLLEAARLIRSHADELAAIEGAENGKPVSIARQFDIETCISAFEYFGGLIGNLPRESNDFGSLYALGVLEPYGVVGGIIPFNWPPIHFGAKVAPALAVGNGIVLKPGEQAPLTIMRLAELVSQVIPDDVVHVVPGKGPTGAALAGHPGVRKISFTGAPTTGQKVLAAASTNLTPALVELGGKNPVVVFEDADLETATRDVIEAGYFNNGCACTAGSRLLVQRSVYDKLTKKVAAAVRALRVGNGADPRTHVGALVTQEHQQKVLAYIEIGKAEGARVAAQTELKLSDECKDGYFVAPTLFVDVTPDMRVAKEEIFGPVVCAIPFDTEEEAIRIANDTDFGLVAGVYSANSERALRVSRAIEAGIVFINNYNRSVVGTPFGGTKASGYGREQCVDTLKEFGYQKTIRIPSGRGEVARWWAAEEAVAASQAE